MFLLRLSPEQRSAWPVVWTELPRAFVALYARRLEQLYGMSLDEAAEFGGFSLEELANAMEGQDTPEPRSDLAAINTIYCHLQDWKTPF